MGLSSLQGRLLMITSRISDIELQEVMISQSNMDLNRRTTEADQVRMDALNNYKLQRVYKESEDSERKQEDLSYSSLISQGILVTNAKNEIYLNKDADGNWIIPKDKDGNTLLSIDEESGKAIVNEKEYNIVNAKGYLDNQDIIQQGIQNGLFFLFDTVNDKEGISKANLDASTEYAMVLDTSDDARAQTEYDNIINSISREENQNDMDLKSLETQHEVAMKEYEEVKNTIESNIDRTFSLFTNA